MFLSNKKNLKKVLLSLLLLSAFLKTYAYSPGGSLAYKEASMRIDSIKSLLSNTLIDKDTPVDTLTINRVNKLAAEFVNISTDSALFYGKIAISKSNIIKYKKGIADGMSVLGRVYTLDGMQDAALQNLTKANLIYIELKDDENIAFSNLDIGKLYSSISNYALAEKYTKQALAVFIKIKNESGIANCYNHFGLLFDAAGKSSTALDNYFKALYINIKLHDINASATNYNNIGTIMQKMEIYPKSMEYYEKALKIWEGKKYISGIGTAYNNIGEIYIAEHNYDKAINFLNKSMKIELDRDEKDGISIVSTDLGLCYAYKNQFGTALKYLLKALEVADKYKLTADKAFAYNGLATLYNLYGDYSHALYYAKSGNNTAKLLGDLSYRTNATLQLSIALEGLKQYGDALKARKEFDMIRDTLKSNALVQRLTSLNLEASFAEKQRTMVEQHKHQEELYQQKIQRQGWISVVFFIIILGMAIILNVYYRSKRKQQRINTILEEKNHVVLQQKTHLDEQTEKLNELNHLKDRLIAVLAHDLRAPLSTLRGLFSLLEHEGITQEQFSEMLPHVLKKLEYTSDFLDTLLFWVNSQMDNFRNSTKVFPVKNAITTQVNNYIEQAAEKGVILTDNTPSDIAVLADPNSISIVTRNLITNAIKFTQKGDTISVDACYMNDAVLITIKDTGVGMPEKQLRKLFKSKVDSGVGTNNEPGTGMGLLFCKDLIEKCNGKIWVESIEGTGTEFFITLPKGETIVMVTEGKLALVS